MFTNAQALDAPFITTLIPGRRPAREPISVTTARSVIRKSRPNADVHVYVTTDRAGTAVHVVHVHFRPGFWSDVQDVTDIYEIPTEALLTI